jgi:hypothetical protein
LCERRAAFESLESSDSARDEIEKADRICEAGAINFFRFVTPTVIGLTRGASRGEFLSER